ncbi:MAG: organomercurial lyase [Halorientalis sp.]
MTTETTRIEPTVDVSDIELPAALGAAIGKYFGVGTVRTAADWLDALETGLDTSGDPISVEDLCTTADSPHVLDTAAGTQAYQCATDPMIVPFLTDEPATVRSRCPISDEEVVFEIEDRAVHARPERAVFSLGIDLAASGDPPHSPAETYGIFCPSGNVFTSRDAYEQWAADTEAITTRLPLEHGVAVVGALASRLSDPAGD